MRCRKVFELTKARGVLKYLILYVLEKEPLHGYGIMKKLGEVLGVEYEPSSGVLYPTLHALEKEGLVTSKVVGRRKVYELTEAGRKLLESKKPEIERFLSRTSRIFRLLKELKVLDLLNTIMGVEDEALDHLPKELRDKVRASIDELLKALQQR